ncbi:MAG TPA: curli production assembly/transport component CsgF [Phaeodactylibacter sp.]|nr:curli production assembly/transport component CsgF [Phaeodactylibacter sp.]
MTTYDLRKLLSFIFLVLCFALPCTMGAQDLVYKPKNPAFGGDTFNYNWLLSSAQLQDLTEQEGGSTSSRDRSSLDFFTESLNRQLLNQLSRELVTNQFGEDGLEEGLYTVGDFQIDISTTLEGLSISIIDISTGDQTQIVIPFF